MFPVPADILQHDDGIIDNKSGRNGQRHEGKVVQTVATHIHHAEGPDERDRHRHAGDDRRSDISQKSEHDKNHQCHRDKECPLDIVQRRANRGSPIQHDRQRDGLGNGRLQLWHLLTDVINRLDDIRPRLSENNHQHGRLPVEQPGRAQILDRVFDLGDVRQLQCRAGPVHRDQRHVIHGLVDLIVRADLPCSDPIGHLSLGPVHIRAAQYPADVF